MNKMRWHNATGLGSTQGPEHRRPWQSRLAMLCVSSREFSTCRLAPFSKAGNSSWQVWQVPESPTGLGIRCGALLAGLPAGPCLPRSGGVGGTQGEVPMQGFPLRWHEVQQLRMLLRGEGKRPPGRTHPLVLAVPCFLP